MDRFDCYECCVQSPRHIVEFLRSAHGGGPLVLREDFCGTAATARRWAVEAREGGRSVRAVGVDLDPEVIARARLRGEEAGAGDRLELICGDVLADGGDGPAAADVVFIGNFSIGYIHDRARLVRYLSRCRERLLRGGDGAGRGILACDIYGGASAFRLGGLNRRHAGPGGETIHYAWVHERADPMTGMVVNSISFRIEREGEIVQELPRAFEYVWRLWSLAELREAMLEAGFGAVEVYRDVHAGPGGRPVAVAGPAELGEDWIVLLVARA